MGRPVSDKGLERAARASSRDHMPATVSPEIELLKAHRIPAASAVKIPAASAVKHTGRPQDRHDCVRWSMTAAQSVPVSISRLLEPNLQLPESVEGKE